MSEKHKEFSNSEDTIYHERTAGGMRFAFLVVSEYFDTPNPEVTRLLKFVCDALNEAPDK